MSWENRRKHVEEMEGEHKAIWRKTHGSHFQCLLSVIGTEQCNVSISIPRELICSAPKNYWSLTICEQLLMFILMAIRQIWWWKQCWIIPISLSSMLKFTDHDQTGNYFNNTGEMQMYGNFFFPTHALLDYANISANISFISFQIGYRIGQNFQIGASLV